MNLFRFRGRENPRRSRQTAVERREINNPTTFGEDSAGELQLANQTFVSAHLVVVSEDEHDEHDEHVDSNLLSSSSRQPPQQQQQQQQQIHTLQQPPQELVAPPRVFSSAPSPRFTHRRRRGLQEEEDDTSEIPSQRTSMVAPNARTRQDRRASQRDVPRSISFDKMKGKQQLEKSSRSLPTLSQQTSSIQDDESNLLDARNRRRKRSDTSNLSSRSANSTGPTEAAAQRHPEAPRGNRWRRRQKSRPQTSPNTQNNNSQRSLVEDPWNALELHPVLQQALLDVYWKRREQERVRLASETTQPHHDKGKPKVAQFLAEQELAMDSINRPKKHTGSSKKVPSPVLSEATTQVVQNNSNSNLQPRLDPIMPTLRTPTRISSFSSTTVDARSPRTPSSRPTIFKEIPVGSQVAAVGRWMGDSSVVSSEHVMDTPRETPPLIPSHIDSERQAPRRSVSDVTMAWELQSQSGQTTTKAPLLPIEDCDSPISSTDADYEEITVHEDSQSVESYDEEEEEILVDDDNDESYSYEEESYYEEETNEVDVVFEDDDYMNDEQLEVWMSAMAGRNQNDSGVSDLIGQTVGTSLSPSQTRDIPLAAYIQQQEDSELNSKMNTLTRPLSQVLDEQNASGTTSVTTEELSTPTKVPTRPRGLESQSDHNHSVTKSTGKSMDRALPPPRLQSAPSTYSLRSELGFRTTFICACCYESKTTKGNGWACDNLASPHMVCTECAKHYVETAYETGAPLTMDSKMTSCQLPCFGHVGCQNLVHLNLRKIFQDDPAALQQVRTRHQESLSAHQTAQERPKPPHPAPEERLNQVMKQIQQAMKEALTDVTIRSCPQCGQTFIKTEDGCNKMKCPTCKAVSCYCCRQIIPKRGYDHFENIIGMNKLSNAKCPLWTDHSIDQVRDQEEMRNVLMNLANRVWGEYLESTLERNEDSPGQLSASSLNTSIADLIAGLPSDDSENANSLEI